MPKDEWWNARRRSTAQQARREYASEGRLVSFESVNDDLHPADLVAGEDRLVAGRLSGRRATLRSLTGGARGIRAKAKAVTVAGVFVPASLADVAVGRKYDQGRCWVLTSKKGRTIATFSTEDDLDRWWATFQRIRGRTPRPLRLGRAPVKKENRFREPLPQKTVRGFVCNPAWTV